MCNVGVAGEPARKMSIRDWIAEQGGDSSCYENSSGGETWLPLDVISSSCSLKPIIFLLTYCLWSFYGSSNDIYKSTSGGCSVTSIKSCCYPPGSICSRLTKVYLDFSVLHLIYLKNF